MERFVVVSTTSERTQIIKATNALESIGIPVIVQHSFKQTEKEANGDFRLMVPDHFSSSASQVIKPIMLKN